MAGGNGRLEAETADRAETSVGKALTVLEILASAPDGLGLTEVASAAGVPKATAHRLLSNLVEKGFVDRRRSRYTAGLRTFELSLSVVRSRYQRLRDIALPHMTDLYETTHDTVQLAILDGRDVFYLEKLHGSNCVRSPSRVGGRLPLHSNSSGKVLLAYSPKDVVREVLCSGPLRRLTPYTTVVPSLLLSQLEEVRSTGVAYDREELALGLASVAAPVSNSGGRVVAAISVVTSTRNFDLASLAPRVNATARQVSTDFSQTA